MTTDREKFKEWFQNEQGTAYAGMFDFAEAAYLACAERKDKEANALRSELQSRGEHPAPMRTVLRIQCV